MKKAIFGTRDIWDYRAQFPGQSPVFVIDEPRPRGAKYPIFSTGKLEQAIAEGYDIYVVSIRPGFADVDNWWRRLVPADHVFVNKGLLPAFTGNPKAADIFNAWRQFYRLLGLPWSDKFTDMDDPRTAAIAVHGLKDGGSFRSNKLLH